jgi:putative photosynthetic complex assembly protein 2
MDNPWIAAFAALILWWLSTGLILWRVRHAENVGGDQHHWSCLLTAPLPVAGVIAAHSTADSVTPMGAFTGFLAALAIWGWIELAFLSGIITGPNRRPCPPGARGWSRFLRSFLTLAWHEAALLAGLLVLGLLVAEAANPFAFWTYAVLFFARISAKLNLFLGVPRVNTEFLPRRLSHLASHFRKAPMNGLFPVSVTVLSLAVACWMERLSLASTPGQTTGFALLFALTLLALLEHWFMVLPVPDQKLWRWMLPAPKPLPDD